MHSLYCLPQIASMAHVCGHPHSVGEIEHTGAGASEKPRLDGAGEAAEDQSYGFNRAPMNSVTACASRNAPSAASRL